ncbi:MAG: hypothetical protein AAGA58_08865 [Verrucomicrobiota bacterium]
MDGEQVSFEFEIPATDALGRMHVAGKLRALEKEVLLHWKIKDRTFTRSKNSLRTVELTYDDIEEAAIKHHWWLFKPHLVMKIKDPRKVEEVPGVKLGRIDLNLPGKSKAEAKRFVSMIDFRVTQHEMEKRSERLKELGI